MKIWTYAEALAKVEADLDLVEETFITDAEMIGYFNEGIEEAESEIHKLDEEYFLTSTPLPLVLGTSAYPYPADCYAFKERGLVYSNGSTIYEINRFKRMKKFGAMAFATQYAAADDYQWHPTNDAYTGPRINLIPPARETAVIGSFAPITLHYLRQANRIPLVGEAMPGYDTFIAPGNVSTAGGFLATAKSYTTGDPIKMYSTGTMPGGLVAGTIYYAFVESSTHLRLAASYANALASVALDIPTAGTGTIVLANLNQPSATVTATQAIVDGTKIDIPEWTKFVLQWVKCRCLEKMTSPLLSGASATLEQQRAQMVSTLTDAQPDDQNEIYMDTSPYSEMT